MITQSIDTNVLLRAAIDLGDEQTRQARHLLADPSCKFIVSVLAVAEFVYALLQHYGMTRQQAAATVRWTIGIESIVCTREVILASLDIFENHPKLSLEDCLMAEQAKASQAEPLWTFDRKLAQQHPVAELIVKETPRFNG